MASSSSVGDNIHDIHDCSTKNVSVYPPTQGHVVKINLFLKGGGLNDIGITYRVNCETKFSRIYMDYARKTNTVPSKLRLLHRTRCIKPEETPFGLAINDNEMILAYDESGRGVAVRPPPSPSCRNRVFIIQDLMNMPSIWRMTIPAANSCLSVYKGWAETHGVASNSVMLYHNGYALNGNLTVEEANIHDGDHMYGYVYRGAS